MGGLLLFSVHYNSHGFAAEELVAVASGIVSLSSHTLDSIVKQETTDLS